MKQSSGTEGSADCRHRDETNSPRSQIEPNAAEQQNDATHQTEANVSQVRSSWFTLGVLVVAVIQAGLFVWQLIYMRNALKHSEAATKASTMALQREIDQQDRRSIHSIARMFEDAAHKWAKRTMEHGSSQTDWHNRSIDRLRPYVGYLEQHHREVFLRICGDWNLYAGGDWQSRRQITCAHYESERDEEFRKEYWINILFRIIDGLRQAPPKQDEEN